LFPITDYANSRHSAEIEQKVKGWVNNDKYWVYYKVAVKNINVNLPYPAAVNTANFVDSDFVCEAYPYTAAGRPSGI